ncbi:MAG: hypothetical protein ACI38Q_07905 [Candidatus Bruticola sp.]
MADGSLERLEKLESNVRGSLSQLRHLQQLSASEMKRDISEHTEQMRREMSEVVARMASLAEVNSLKDDIKKVFDLVGGQCFSGSSPAVAAPEELSAVDKRMESLEKKLQSCENRLNQVLTATEKLSTRVDAVANFEERLAVLEEKLASFKGVGEDNGTKKKSEAAVFEDEPVEWG